MHSAHIFTRTHSLTHHAMDCVLSHLPVVQSGNFSYYYADAKWRVYNKPTLVKAHAGVRSFTGYDQTLLLAMRFSSCPLQTRPVQIVTLYRYTQG